jgi:6-phosphogluconolactonase
VAAQCHAHLPAFTTDTIVPTGVNVLANNGAVYVSAYDQVGLQPRRRHHQHRQSRLGLRLHRRLRRQRLWPSSGSPYKAGVKPSALISDPTNRFVYVTDFASNQLIGYTIQGGSTLDFLINGPFKTGNEPNSHRHRSARQVHLRFQRP